MAVEATEIDIGLIALFVSWVIFISRAKTPAPKKKQMRFLNGKNV